MELNFLYTNWKDYNNKYYIDIGTCIEKDTSLDIFMLKVTEKEITTYGYGIDSNGHDYSFISHQEYGLQNSQDSEICYDTPQEYLTPEWCKEITKEEFDDILKFISCERNPLKEQILKYKNI